MKITVILCTYNRCKDLRRALNSFNAQSLSTGDNWEVLVVDNNSTDKTRDVVEEYRQQHPDRFRYHFEPQPGKTFALNAGVREARGDILAFTDDDVILEPAWLENLVVHLHGSEWAGAGGRTLPQQNFSPPRWLSLKGRYALAPLAIFDRGNEPGDLREAPFGVNMAYRKEVFTKYGGFRNDLGPRPGSTAPQKSEDSEFGMRVLAAGERLRYEPGAVLYHAVPENRVRKKYFQDWWFDKNRADTRIFGVDPGTKWFIAGIPLYLLRRISVWTLRWMFAIDPAARFDCKLKVWGLAGCIVESHRMSLEETTKRECHARP